MCVALWIIYSFFLYNIKKISTLATSLSKKRVFPLQRLPLPSIYWSYSEGERETDPASSFSTRRWRHDVYKRQCKTRVKCEGWKGRTARRDKCKKFIPIHCGNLVISTQNFRQELHNYRGGGVVGRGEGGKREEDLYLSPFLSCIHGFPSRMSGLLGCRYQKVTYRHICSIPHSGYSYTLIRNISRENIDIVHYRVLVKALCNVIC